jgi:hypothetical protein
MQAYDETSPQRNTSFSLAGDAYNEFELANLRSGDTWWDGHYLPIGRTTNQPMSSISAI